MKKTIVITVLAIMSVFSAVNQVSAEGLCPLSGEKLVFTEFGLSYGSVTDPSYISDNTTGVLDTAVFDAKAGVNLFKWVDLYAGGSFQFYMQSDNWNANYTFLPLFFGLRANIFPEWPVYPSVSMEGGMAFASHHYIIGPSTIDDQPWTASYYNFGIAANWTIADVAILSLSIERPAFSNNAGSEIHIFKTGLSWKIFY